MVLIGYTGRVGSEVDKILQRQSTYLASSASIKVQVVCRINTKTMKFVGTGEEMPTDFAKLVEELERRKFPNVHIVDMTASDAPVPHYADFLHMGCVVVAANKRASSGDLNLFDQLKSFRLVRRYRFEATVMAGLPVMSTLHSLKVSGDTLHRIEGVFSGTLSFLFDSRLPFKEAVLEAKRRGYTEPDPREDLSGLDFQRKMIILAREMEMRVSMSDIEWNSDKLVTEKLAAMSLEEFLESGLDEIGQRIDIEARAASQAGKRLVFAGSIEREPARLSIGLKAVDMDSPFGGLHGANNLIVITSSYYPEETPLVITGPGAGATVTAAGVVSDILLK